MNLPVPSIIDHLAVEATSERLLRELSDTDSIWYHLRIAEMLGCDHIFVPVQFARRLHRLGGLEQFVHDVHELTGSPLSRIVPIQYGYNAARILRFIRYEPVWSGGRAVAVTRKPLNHSAQLDFISTLYEHSEPLIIR